MAAKRRTAWLIEEMAGFLASCPSPEQLRSYRPSARVQERARGLLGKSNSGRMTPDEQWELARFEHAEMLMQRIKARVRADRAVRR